MTPENRSTRFPAGVVIAAAIALAFMIAWSAVHWPEMAPTIVTREAGGSHGASIIPRGFSASAMPVTLVLVSSLMAISPWVNAKFSSLTGMPMPRYDRSTARVRTATQAGLCLVMCAMHVFVVGLHTGTETSALTLVAMSLGALLVLLGIYLPIAQSDVETNDSRLNALIVAQRSMSRSAGISMVVVGLATIAGTTASPWLGLAIGGSGAVAITVTLLVASLVRAIRLSRPRHRHP